jgi:putative heme iron utilization protein
MEKKSIVQRGFHGKFTAIRKLKAGATARVFKCYRNRDKKNVAVKAFNT